MKKNKIVIKSRVPTRIDISGGTLDIWPLYLFHKGAKTVNAAINLYAKVKITVRNDKKIVIKSVDTNKTVIASSINSLKEKTDLELISRIIKFFNPLEGIDVETFSGVPAGSGLGGSSALAIATCGALSRLTGRKLTKSELINITKDIEGQVIKVPPGVQDYYSAVFGGINSVNLNVGSIKPERLEFDYNKLRSRILLVYTGKTRFSGTNNWQITKDHIDRKGDTFKKIDKISKTSILMKEALINEDFSKIGKLLNVEWENRKSLSAGVTNKRIDSLINVAKKNGAISAKICGAGGGGCMIVFVEMEKRAKVKDVLTKEGAQILDYKFVRKGLTVTEVGRK